MSSHLARSDLVVPFECLRMSDVGKVGGKNASLGEMISQLSAVGIRVPGGFATTAAAFNGFLDHNSLMQVVEQTVSGLDVQDLKALSQAGAKIREMILAASLQPEFEQAIRDAFAELEAKYPGASFAVRSSATAEDLPDASFAGQQETYLNVQGIDAVLLTVKQVFASLYNDRAIAYRVHQGYDKMPVALSVGVQKMVRSDLGSSGVMFSLDTESGFKDVVLITSSYGLGETVVQGAVNPDEFYVFKPTLAQDKDSIVQRVLGSKAIKMLFSGSQTGERVLTEPVPQAQRTRFSISDKDVVGLAKFAVLIEQHYGRPMDIEWGLDGNDGHLYILQARPETVKSRQESQVEQKFSLKETGAVLATGRAIGQRIGSGTICVVHSAQDMEQVQPGDILVADMTDPNWEPVMKRAAAIVTDRGGRTCHAAIIARELGVPAVVGCENATSVLQDGEVATVSCVEGDEGRVYKGALKFEVQEMQQTEMPDISPLKIMMNVGNPRLAFEFSQRPNDGVGLARLEFIINQIGIHPQAVFQYPSLPDGLRQEVEQVIVGYADPVVFYLEKLVEGISTVAAAFYPKPVIVRLSDFKSNEYRRLLGGDLFEPEEENPMLGFRGVARYLSEDFRAAFALECQAIKRVREDMGLSNVEVMVPFVRNLSQAEQVVALLGENGLVRGQHGLRLIMMCEVPSNALLADEFLAYFDGFSIGSNDLTQLTLGLDRDSGMPILVADFDERDLAVKKLISMAIAACRKQGKYIGICGQGPSDHLDFANWLLSQGISSLSLNPDTVISTWSRLAKKQ